MLSKRNTSVFLITFVAIKCDEVPMKWNTLNINGLLLTLERPLVMGILNVTPNSFYEASRKQTESEVAAEVERLLSEGADIIDVGACSTRPDAAIVSKEEETERLRFGLQALRKVAPQALVSVDTFRADVACMCVEEYGVGMVNDISGGTFDKDMFATVAKLRTPYILMYIQGEVESMHRQHTYADVTADTIKALAAKVSELRGMGVHDIILDPGFGFSKTLEQNYELVAHLADFQVFELPLLVGISRKSMIWRQLDIRPEEALNGTTALHMAALERGADILRVHDVKQAVEAVRIYEELTKYQSTK